MNFQSLVGNLRRKAFTHPATRVRPRKPNYRLRIQELEAREVPATIPAPIVDQSSFRSITDNGWAPTTLADPTNEQQLVTAYVGTPVAPLQRINLTDTRVALRFSTDGGKTWVDFGMYENGFDPKETNPPRRFFEVSNPSIAFDRFHNVFLTYTEHRPDQSTGRLMLRKYHFEGSFVEQDVDGNPNNGLPRVLYSWYDGTRAFNPNVAVDTNEGQFQDPDNAAPSGLQRDGLAASQTDANHVKVFVNWNTEIRDEKGNIPPRMNPYVIGRQYSGDGGRTWADLLLINDTGYLQNTLEFGPYIQSKTVFTPGRAGEAPVQNPGTGQQFFSGGRMVTLFTSNTGREQIPQGPDILPTIFADSVTVNTAANAPTTTEKTVTNQTINDGVNDYSFNVTAADGVATVDNISIALRINHNALADLRADLIAPGGQTATLFLNKNVPGVGAVQGRGVSGTQLGDGAASCIFVDSAFLPIQDGQDTATAPYRGMWLPENPFQSLLAFFQGVNAVGTWRLRITDFTVDTNTPRVLQSASLRIGQGIGNFGGLDKGTGARPATASFTGYSHPTKPAFAPQSGVGPGLVAWVDNTLGSFSPYQNRIYMAYSTGDHVEVMYSDGVDQLGGALWNNAPQDVGQGYLPQLTVDPTTGTLVLAYYTTRFDASNTRSTMVLQTAVNQAAYRDRFGTIEFSPATYVTPHEDTYDQIRSKVIDVEPIPSNGPVAGPEMWGNNVGLAAYNGRVNLVYTGNLDIDGALTFPITNNGSTLRTQNIQIAAGPRLVDGDMGPILGSAQVASAFSGSITYNQPSGGDGRNRFTGFEVEFDRVIDPTTFTPADVKVIFRGPNDPPTGPGTVIPVVGVTDLDNITDPVDGSSYGSKRFLISVTPQTAVGTYSYLIGANTPGGTALIRDRVRSKITTYTSPRTTTVNFNGPPSVIQDYAGFEVPNQTSAQAGGYAPNEVITDINVKLNISHTNMSNLLVQLIHPSLHTITLVRQGDAKAGANFTNTVFDDSADRTLQSQGEAPPYTATYRPTDPLSHFFGLDPNDPTTFPFAPGIWTLQVTDLVSGDTGTVDSWQLILTTSLVDQVVTETNGLDQDADGVENEPAFTNASGDLEVPDGFSVPDPKTNVVFQLPYQVESLPIVIAGPRLVGSRVPGQPQTTDNLVKNDTNKAIDVQFDRVINSATFKPEDVLRIVGPLGSIPLNGLKVTPIDGLNGAVIAGNSKFFRIEFAEQKLSGTYSIQLSSQIEDTDGNKLDTNTNAGVGNLVGTVTNADVTVKPYGGAFPAVTIAPNATTTITLNVADAYLVKRVEANIFVTHANTRDLEGRLIAPDGTTVLLFVNAPQSGDASDFRNTTFVDDERGTPVQLGGSHFTNGFFNPINPLAQLIDHGSKGVWKLEIKNKGGLTGSITSFGLNIDRPVVGTGLGEEVADQTTVSFRIQQTDPSAPVAKGNWSPLGPAPQVADGNNSTAGRVEAIAVDPSDPSGNTVYAAGASGGVWRTTNFMTRDVNGPTWVPLTDFGPNNAINVGSLAVFNDTGVPGETRIIVGTGSDDANEVAKSEFREGTWDPNSNGTTEQRFDGLGFLSSDDAGKTWQVLDSTNNFDPITNTYRPQADGGRDHLFVGAVVNRLVVETKADQFSHRPIIYAAVGKGSSTGGAEGLWRSRDGGRTWNLIKAGEATDFQLGLGSQLINSAGRPTIGYLAIKGQGVFFSDNLDNVSSFTLMDMNGGNPGRPTVQQGGIPIPVNGPSETPNGAKGRIVLATPAFMKGDALANNYYQRWLYAAVANPDGTFDGLYVTKDRGYNWTKIKLTTTQGFSDVGPDDDFTTDLGFQGANHSFALAVDPNDPNIVYLGGDALIQIDATLVNDPYNLSLYNHGNEFTGMRPNLPGSTTDGAGVGGGLTAFDFNRNIGSLTPTTLGYEDDLTASVLRPDLTPNARKRWNHINMDRDPYNQFRTDTTLVVTNTNNFNNDGRDVKWVVPGGDFAEIPYEDIVDEGIVKRTYNANWVSQILTIKDPITGLNRLVYGSDEGITSYVSTATGDPLQMNGFIQDFQEQGDPANHDDIQTTGRRNGNLQVARLYSGDTQPSLLAATISQSFAYGAARRMGDMQVSPEDVLGAGGINWKGDDRGTRANYVAADQLGKGVVYVLRRVNDLPFVKKDATHVWARTDFFQVSLNGSEPISRTNGLFQNTADALGTGQWTNIVRTFTVNTIDADGVVMGSADGRLFRTRDQGLNWNAIAEPGTLDGSYLSALAFGAPEPNATNLNDFIYAGSEDGNIWVTVTGGGNLPGSWQNITTGSFGALDGSPVMKIVTNPQRGSHELFVVTQDEVYHMADWTAPGALWEKITANLKTITSAAFGNAGWRTPVLATDNPLTSIAVDWRPTYGSSIGNPILYVGGDGGVFSATYNADATLWDRFTGPGQNAASDGGGLPVVKVTDVDLALGNIDKNTGRVIPAGSPSVLVATTLGRGMWSVAIEAPIGFSGPKVIEASPTVPQFQPIDHINIKFDSFISVETFTTADVTITGPNGQSIPVNQVVDTTNPPPGQANLHNEWRIEFPSLAADGTYTIRVGPNILSGNVPMNQDGDLTNGENPDDQFVLRVAIGLNDLADYVKDTYQALLGRLPITAEFEATTVKNMETARLAALGVITKEFLSTFNSSEARQRMIERFFVNGSPNLEISNLLPGYTLPSTEKAFYLSALKNGTKSPEGIIIDIIATTDVNKGFYQDYFVASAPPGQATPLTFLTKMYDDLFRFSNPQVRFSFLPAATQTSQLTQAATPGGRLTLTRSIVNGALVKFFPNGDTNQPQQTTDFRTHEVNLAYQKYLGRTPTAAEVTAGKSLIARPLALNSIQGSEWLYWKVLSSLEYFNRVPAQADGLVDDGLHTDRGWIQAFINDRMYRASTTVEENNYSQKLLDRFKTQRAAFVNSIVFSSTTAVGLEYRDLQITGYFQLIHSRNPTTDERAAAQLSLKNGTSFPALMAARFGSAEFYNVNAPQIAGGTVSPTTWAKAVYLKLFNRLPTPTEQTALANQAGTVSSRTTAVQALLNGTAYRDILITSRFQLLLNRVPTQGELTAYQNWLKTHRWETLIVDLIANGAASPTITAGLPRQFWEVAN